MEGPPPDLDRARAEVAARGLVAEASRSLTEHVAMRLPFEALGRFKTALKRFFSPEPWTEADAVALSELVAPHLAEGWWEHDVGEDLRLVHGIRAGDYHLWVTGGGSQATTPSIFERVFAGPVVPEPTPHPRKVKFVVGGTPAPGRWHRRSDPEPLEDPAIARLFEERDVTDVMVAGDFVTIGLVASSSWEDRLDPLLELVTDLFWTGASPSEPVRTREELLHEAGHLHPAARPEELHLLDPDDREARTVLVDALGTGDARIRRIAVAVLAESDDDTIRMDALERGARDESRIVRRTAIDAAADLEDEAMRPLFEQALGDDDPWTRWKAVRSIGALGLASSRNAVDALADDEDFQVRFEVARVTRRADQSP